MAEHRKKSRYNLSDTEQIQCHKIIHSASASATVVGAGFAQLPLADNAVLTPIQITMIISLGKVFDQNITKTIAKGILASMLASVVGRGISQVAWGWIPGIGNANNAITAGAITETVGWLCVDNFYHEKYSKKKELGIVLKEETIQKDNDERENLISRAQEFISGTKKILEHREEFGKLFDEITIYLSDVKDKELLEIQKQLMNLM